jgi:CRISPR-associated protein (TIGR03986 family)
MAKGKIIRIFEDKGYGFIQPDERGGDIWFHATKLQGELSFTQLKVGLEVEYETEMGRRGGQQAKFVRIIVSEEEAQNLMQSATNYRFLNPYNFVRFLSLPESQEGKKQIQRANQPKNAITAAFAKIGVQSNRTQINPEELKLLSSCAPPPHDRYVGLTGKITCTLENVTPLFISDPDYEPIGEHKRFEFFKLNNEHALPAASLRGMVRNVFEAITNSCIASSDAARSTDERLSYHLPPGDALKLVPARVEKDGNGNLILRLLSGTTKFVAGQRPSGVQYGAWVLRYLPPLRRSQSIPSQTDYGKRQIVQLNGHKHGSPCWALLKLMKHPRRNFQFWNVQQIADKQAKLPQPQIDECLAEGFLCINNQNIENKHDERFFFYDGGLANAPTVQLSKEVCKAYKALIEDYQQRHKDKVKKRKKPEVPDKDKPAYSRFIVHPQAADLREGDLVYAMLNSSRQVEFVVPVSVPRVAYERHISALLPNEDLQACNDPECLCPACRVFGWVHQSPDATGQVAYAGRLRFTNGKLMHSAGTLPQTPLSILSSPKPTTTRFYITPKDGLPSEKWSGESAEEGYNSENNILRGRKFYRHHGIAREEEYRRTGDICDDQNRTVKDALSPGAQFEFNIDFENLAPIELGAFLWALEMDGQGYHRLGAAKPLGFGSVKISIREIKALDMMRRYSTLIDGGWKPLTDWTKLVESSKRALASRYKEDEFEDLPNVQDLRALLNDPPNGLPVHYPRTARHPDPSGKNFEWFMGNNRYVYYRLMPATQDEGLPLITRDGAEVK